MNDKFEDVRQWAQIRGLKHGEFFPQFNKVLEEVTEIMTAYINEDMLELKDGIGDSLVTIINLAKTVGLNAEDCLDDAFDVIHLRKGLVKNGIFVRYAKLSDEEKAICDEKQGNPGDQYFLLENKENLSPSSFLA